jgi:hypothetical protein
MPFTSKDLDLVGSAGLLDRLYDSHKGPERKGFDQSSGRNLGNRHE